MSKKATNKELLAQLQEKMAADVPPVLAKMNESPPPPPPPPLPLPPPSVAAQAEQPEPAARPPRPAKPAKPPRPSPADAAGRTGINLNVPAVAALKRLQAFFLTECGGTSSASAAVCIALEHAAAGLPGNKGELAALYEANRQADKRRRPA